MAIHLMSDSRRLVDKLWSYCNVLRDDGVGTIEYTEQLTYLLFLKMAHERENRALNPERIVPESCSWQGLLDADGDYLEAPTATSWRTALLRAFDRVQEHGRLCESGRRSSPGQFSCGLPAN